MTIKTMAQWREAKVCLTTFLQVGDFVDDAIYDAMLGAVPPVTNRRDCMQMGEPYSSTATGQPTFITFTNSGEYWQYAGIMIKAVKGAN